MGVVVITEEGDGETAMGFCDYSLHATVVVLYVVAQRSMGCCSNINMVWH